MKKTPESNRSIKWLSRNSLCFSNCEKYVRYLCDDIYGIEQYEIKEYEDDEKALCVVIDGKTYYVYADRENIFLICKIDNRIVKTWKLDDCWSCAVEFIGEILDNG